MKIKIHSSSGAGSLPVRFQRTAARPVKCRSCSGFLQIDLVVALAILGIAILPLGFSFAREHQVLKAEYNHSVANEIVDGEMEILVAGEAKNFPDGSQNYAVPLRAAANLPKGHFQLTKNGKHLRLEWLPDGRHGLGVIVRETTLP